MDCKRSHRLCRWDTDLYGYCLNDPINWIDPWGLKLTFGQNAIASYGASIIGSIAGGIFATSSTVILAAPATVIAATATIAYGAAWLATKYFGGSDSEASYNANWAGIGGFLSGGISTLSGPFLQAKYAQHAYGLFADLFLDTATLIDSFSEAYASEMKFESPNISPCQ